MSDTRIGAQARRWGVPRDPFVAALCALTALCLIPVWGFRFFPSQDGPSHLYNTYVLLHWNDPSAVFSSFYEIDLTPVPNWLATALLYALMSFLPALVAEKLLLSIYVVALAACWWAWLDSAAGRRSPLVLLGPLLSCNFFLYKGFYSFCLSVPLFLLVMAFIWSHRQGLNLRSAGGLNLLLALTFLAHFVSFGVGLALALLLLPLHALRRGARLRGALAQAAWLSPCLVLLGSYLAGPEAGRAAGWGWGLLLRYLARAEWLVYYGDSQLPVSCGLALLVAILMVRAGLRAARRRWEFSARWPLALSAGLLAGLYLVMPRGAGGGWHISERLSIYPFLVIAPLMTPDLGRRARAAVGLVAAALTAGQVGISVAHQASIEADLAEYVSLVDRVEPGSVLLPLRWEADDTSIRFRPLLHAADYYALRTGGINLGNYEARTRHFQVRFRKDAVLLEDAPRAERPAGPFLAVAPPHRQIERDPAAIDMRRYADGIDYLITWNLRELAPQGVLTSYEEAAYDRVAANGRVMLFHRRAGRRGRKDTERPAPADGKHRGVSWVAGGRITEKDLHALADDHVTWIVQTPFGWQRSLDAPEVILASGERIFWGESDPGLETTARMARRLGIRSLQKPHIWIHPDASGRWRGQIAMRSERDWRRWFDSYRAFILHYARLAEKSGFDALCVGTELHATVTSREADWRRLIADARALYHGKLLYAANWYREFEEVAFWDALDYIGIQAYFPLTDREDPPVEELRRGWRRHLEAIERVQRKYGKPVLFTEIGYRSTPDAAIEPWRWPESRPRSDSEAGLRTQANCYQAFFETFWKRDWFAGAYFWKWYPGLARRGGRIPGDFSPQNKPAEGALAAWYAGTSVP